MKRWIYSLFVVIDPNLPLRSAPRECPLFGTTPPPSGDHDGRKAAVDDMVLTSGFYQDRKFKVRHCRPVHWVSMPVSGQINWGLAPS